LNDAGWIKLHRSITDSFVFDNPDRLKFWLWCLCKASHKDRKQTVGLQEIQLTKGQFVFGRKKASTELSMDESKIYRLLKTFEKREKVEVKSNNKYSLVTVVNWSFYQGSEQQSEQQMNNKLTTNEQQSNTNKNVKKERRKEIDIFIPPTITEIEVYVLQKEYCVNPKQFFDYYDSADWVNAKGKKVTSWKRTVVTWNSRELKNNPNAKPFIKKTKSVKEEKPWMIDFVSEDNDE